MANDTATAAKSERAERRTPRMVVQGEDGEIPSQKRSGYWQDAIRTIKDSPNKLFVFEDVSPTRASTLRREEGFDAATRTENGTVRLYVVYRPDKVDEIKADVARRAAKRAETVKANGNKPAKAAVKK